MVIGGSAATDDEGNTVLAAETTTVDVQTTTGGIVIDETTVTGTETGEILISVGRILILDKEGRHLLTHPFAMARRSRTVTQVLRKAHI